MIRQPDEITQGIFLGGISENKNWYIVNKIKAVFNVSDIENNDKPDDIDYYHETLKDFSDDERIYHITLKIIQLIHKYRSEGENIFIHCQMGVSRSATILAAYYMIYHNLSMEDTLDMLNVKRNIICPNLGFCIFLHNLEDNIIINCKTVEEKLNKLRNYIESQKI